MFKCAVHPGEVLKDELEEMGVTPTAFARQINVPPNRIGQIIAGKRSVTGDTVPSYNRFSLRFGHWFGDSRASILAEPSGTVRSGRRRPARSVRSYVGCRLPHCCRPLQDELLNSSPKSVLHTQRI